MVLKFRKKSVVIEAIIYTGDNFEECKKFCPEIRGPFDRSCNVLQVKTTSGYASFEDGDFIVQSVLGDFYPCKPDVFITLHRSIDTEETTKTTKEVMISIEHVDVDTIIKLNRIDITSKRPLKFLAVPDNPNIKPFELSEEWVATHEPKLEGGYYIRYKNGSAEWIKTINSINSTQQSSKRLQNTDTNKVNARVVCVQEAAKLKMSAPMSGSEWHKNLNVLEIAIKLEAFILDGSHEL